MSLLTGMTSSDDTLTLLDKARLSIAVLGDSRVQNGLSGYLTASTADAKGVDIVTSLTGKLVTAGTGTLEYRASDKAFRWTAPGDSAGAWTVCKAGVTDVPSASASMELALRVRALSTAPGTDQTITMTVSGTYQLGYSVTGFWVEALDHLKWPPQNVVSCGIAGSTTADALEQLERIEELTPGPGVDIVHLAGNDVLQGVDSATTITNLRAFLDARRAKGRTPVIMTEGARWGAAVDTPLSAGDIVKSSEIDAFLAAYAVQYGLPFFDTLAATADVNYTDRRPIAGILLDTVHYNATGAHLVGRLLATAVEARLGTGAARLPGDTTNRIDTIGHFTGTGGTKGAGASGTVADGWTVTRTSTDATTVASLEAHENGGFWQKLVWTGTTTGRIWLAVISSQTLSSLGLQAGDTVYCEVDVDPIAITNTHNIRIDMTAAGANPALQVYGGSGSAAGLIGVTAGSPFRLRTYPYVIGASETGLTPRFHIEIGSNAAGTVRFAAAAIVKVA